MEVPVLSKRGQRLAQASPRLSVLGDGLLERARSTTLALLGVTGRGRTRDGGLRPQPGLAAVAGGPMAGADPAWCRSRGATALAVLGRSQDRSEFADRLAFERAAGARLGTRLTRGGDASGGRRTGAATSAPLRRAGAPRPPVPVEAHRADQPVPTTGRHPSTLAREPDDPRPAPADAALRSRSNARGKDARADRTPRPGRSPSRRRPPRRAPGATSGACEKLQRRRLWARSGRDTVAARTAVADAASTTPAPASRLGGRWPTSSARST